MRINNNISSLHTQGALFMNNRAVSNDLEKLSTGLRINRASDDAAGLAVSEGLRTQVRGAQQAKRNALDGISALNIAEGAMNELHGIMQRQRELAIQASTSTYSETERNYMQQEFQALSDEIERIIEETNFNGIQLLTDGATPSARAANMEDIRAWGAAGKTLARENAATAFDAAFTLSADATASQQRDFFALRDAVMNAAAERTVPATGLTAATTLSVLLTDTGIDHGLTLTGATVNSVVGGVVHRVAAPGTQAVAVVAGADVQSKVVADFRATQSDGTAWGTAIPTLRIEDRAVGQFNGEHLWIGANDQRNVDSILIEYGAIDQVNARIDGSNPSNAIDAISAMDQAIEQVSQARADIGALVNRLESTINNLTVSIVNQQAAESQIRDVDFASQASKFTTNQILVQSATSMLSQANASTQGVLALLR